MSEQNKRNFTRIKFERQVNLDFQDESFDSCMIKDLNLTGMFVFGTFTQQVNTTCLIILDQKGESSDLTLSATAKVVRTTEEGIAIEFKSMTFESYMFLQATLLYEAGDPISIGLEFPENCPFEVIEEEQHPSHSTFTLQ